MNGGSAPRVLFWSEYYWPYIGGPEIMAARLLPALRDRGFRFTVLTSQHQLDLPSEDEVDGIPILRIPFRGPIERGDVEAVGRIVHRIEEIKRFWMPELVHLLGLGSAALYQLRTRRARLCRDLAQASPELQSASAFHARLQTPMRLVDCAQFYAEHDDHHLLRIRRLRSMLAGAAG